MAISANRRKFLQLRRLKRLPIGALFLLIVVLTAAIATLILSLASNILGPNSPTNDAWGHLNVIISVLTFSFAIGAGVSVLVQISEANDSRNLGLYADIYEKLMSNEEIEARRYIYQNFPGFGLPGTPEQKAAIETYLRADKVARDKMKQVLNLLDYLGFLIEQDWMTADAVIDWLSPVVVKLWMKIGPVVMYERALRPEEPDYYQAAVNLADRCQRWRAKYYPTAARISFDQQRL